MRHWSAERIAAAAGGTVVRPAAAGPRRAVIDSREVGPGDLFVGLPGSRVDGGRFAAGAQAAGAWGVLVTPEHADGLEGGAVIAAADPLGALGRLAREWRRELDAQVIGVTGSVGKTSTKELIAAMLAPHRSVVASRANFNTEIGLPLEVLGAPAGTDVLVLEMAMRGFGQIAELAAIAEPDVGVITNIAPVHLEQVGDLEGVARAKGELLGGLGRGATAVVPADEPLLEPWLREDLHVVRFSDGDALGVELPAGTPAHQRRNAAAAVAAARAVGVTPSGRVEAAFGPLHGERVRLRGGAVVLNDCYNANPLSMRAALDDLAEQDPGGGRRVAVLGDMLELGQQELEHHRAVGAHARAVGVEVLVAVGPRAREMLPAFDGEGHAAPDAERAVELVERLARPGDLILVKGSRGVGLEVVAERLRDA